MSQQKSDVCISGVNITFLKPNWLCSKFLKQ